MYNVKGGILVGILAATSLSWILRLSPAPAAVFETPTLSGTFLGLDLRPLIVRMAVFFCNYGIASITDDIIFRLIFEITIFIKIVPA